jgi:hypothetical protein
VLGAKFDEMSPEDLQQMADSMPNARAWISENGSHMAMYDGQIAYFRKLLTFLKSAQDATESHQANCAHNGRHVLGKIFVPGRYAMAPG